MRDRLRRDVEPADAPTVRTARVAGVVAGIVFAPIGMLLASLVGLGGWWVLLGGLGSGALAMVVVRYLSYGIAVGMARAIAAFLFPSGDSGPYEATFSAHDALEARGDVEGAIAAYEETLRSEPQNVRALRQAAELHVRSGRHVRAAELLQGIRRVPSAGRADELYATQRLAGLYLDSLGDDGRGLVELRRLVERFPGTREAKGAQEAIRRLKESACSGVADTPPRPPPG